MKTEEGAYCEERTIRIVKMCDGSGEAEHTTEASSLSE